MAKIDPANVAPDALPRIRGVVNTRISRGVIIAQAWPKKRGPSKTAAQIFLTKQFGRAGQMAANAEPMSAETARFFSKGTVWLPRDLLVRAAYGNLFEITLPDGTQAYPTFKGYPGQPTPPEETVRQWFYNFSNNWLASAASTSAYASKGHLIVTDIDLVINGFRSIFAAVSGATYVAGIYTLDGSNVITAAQIGTPQTISTSVRKMHEFDLDATVSAGDRIAIMLSRTDGANTYALPLVASNNANWLTPCTDVGYARLAQANPAIGHTVETGVNPFALGLLIDL